MLSPRTPTWPSVHRPIPPILILTCSLTLRERVISKEMLAFLEHVFREKVELATWNRKRRNSIKKHNKQHGNEKTLLFQVRNTFEEEYTGLFTKLGREKNTCSFSSMRITIRFDYRLLFSETSINNFVSNAQSFNCYSRVTSRVIITSQEVGRFVNTRWPTDPEKVGEAASWYDSSCACPTYARISK